MHTGYSPYDMCAEATRLIELLKEEALSTESEKQIILLLNKLEEYDHTSQYQLSIARKLFADMYYQYGINGNALEQYNAALILNSKIAVNKRIKELSKIPQDQLAFSLDCNMVGDPDYSNLNYHKLELPEEYLIESTEQEKKLLRCSACQLKNTATYIMM